jgi:hypothetical protein
LFAYPKVYLVMCWNNSDSKVIGIFGDRAKAEDYLARSPGGKDLTIEEHALDECLKETVNDPQIYRWFNVFNFHWNDWSLTEGRRMSEMSAKPVFCKYDRDFCVYVHDRISMDRARKIATEKAQEYKRLAAIGHSRNTIISLLNRDHDALKAFTFDAVAAPNTANQSA